MSLLQFLNRGYFSLFALSTVMFLLLMSYMNNYGMDDTTEYYMIYEAEVLSDYYQADDKIEAFDLGRKEYYWGDKALPQKYTQLMAEKPALENQANLYLLDGSYVYILPYINENLTSPFYVIHLFSQESEYQNGHNFRYLMNGSAILAFACLAVFIFILNQRVSRQIRAFDRWMKVMPTLPIGQIHAAKIPSNVSFQELLDAGSSLTNSLAEINQLQCNEQQRVQQEKDMLSCLSHELRTPISVISAAIAVLNKRGQLSDNDKAVLAKLAKANDDMTLLTNTLLQLWRKQESMQSRATFCLANIVEEATKDYQLYSLTKSNLCKQPNHSSSKSSKNEQDIHFNINISDEQQITADMGLVSIVVRNILRNACQYTTNQHVTISVSRNSITVSNEYDGSALSKSMDSNTSFELSYGFGLGLFLVEKICQQQQWGFNIENTSTDFKVSLIISSVA